MPVLSVFAFLLLFMTGIAANGSGVLEEYTDSGSGFSFLYPDYWILVTDVDSMLSVIDGPIDLIREEEMGETERSGYKVLVHVDGSPDYLSNITVQVHPHRPDGSAVYENSESAVQAVASDFEGTKTSGTFKLEETYLGDSHAFVYRRFELMEEWDITIRITYYLTASTTRAYLLVETVLEGALTDVYTGQFNQVIQSFRVSENETGAIDPSLDWGAFKPGEDPESGGSDVEFRGMEVTENFNDNTHGWPVNGDTRIREGRYELDSMAGFPFTVTSTGMGQIAFDFSYEGEVEFTDGDESAGYGLVFAYRDPDNYFAFLVMRGGRFLLVEEKDGVIEQLVPWTASPLLEGDSHLLMVQGSYQTLNNPDINHRYDLVLLIDDQEVGRMFEDDVLDVSGWYGIFVSEGLNVAFDTLTSRNFLIGGIMTLDRFEY